MNTEHKLSSWNEDSFSFLFYMRIHSHDIAGLESRNNARAEKGSSAQQDRGDSRIQL